MDEVTGNSGVTAIADKVWYGNKQQGTGIGEVAHSKYLNYKLALGGEETVYGLHRVRWQEISLFAIEYTYMPKQDFEDIENFDFFKSFIV